MAAPPGSMGLPHGHLYDPQRPGSSFRQCFQLMGLLGRGSYGTVFKVRSLADGRLYALKRSARPFRGPTERQRSLLEAHRHRAVGRSPHCVQLWAAWEERGVLYLQSQLCSEGSLHHHRHHHRHGGPLWGWRLSAYLWDLLGALRHLHGRRMSHGDVRPSNAMLDGGRCLLGDFGWCGEEGGSGRYAAPEAAEATAEATTAEGDVFSLGLTVAEVALGERADDGETWTELRGGRLPHALRAALPPELLPLLAAMLDPDPQRRPTAEALLQSAPMRRVGRWRPLLRLLDVGLRRGAELLQSCRAALRRMWGALWGRAMGQSTPPHTPLLPHIDPWDDEEEEEDSEALWGRSPPGSPTAFRPTASTPQHRGSPPSTPEGSPTAMGRLRRTLTFEEDSEPHSAAP